MINSTKKQYFMAVPAKMGARNTDCPYYFLKKQSLLSIASKFQDAIKNRSQKFPFTDNANMRIRSLIRYVPDMTVRRSFDAKQCYTIGEKEMMQANMEITEFDRKFAC